MSRHRDRIREPLKYTLTQLEEQDWGPPSFDSSLVQSVHRLRNVRLGDLTAGDVRLLIGQKISLPFLVPLALDILDSNPFIEGSYYPGDLLAALLETPQDYWTKYPDVLARTAVIAQKSLATIDGVDVGSTVRPRLEKFLEGLAS